jgi:murein DD-endopeptidase MepM/ murein hydrolase activator NlpD
MARRMSPRLWLLPGVAALPLALFAVLPLASSSAPKNLDSKIERKRDQIAWRKGRETVLASDISGYTRRINALQGEITTLQTRQVRLQADLDAKRAELARIQEDLRRERLRLARLRKRLAEARAALAGRLVELYKADQPDLVTVVLESDGFADLLERTEFMQRVSKQDARIIGIVRRAKADAIATARRLDRLERRSELVARQIEDEVQQVSAVKGQLVERRTRYADARSEKSSLLSKTRDDRHALEGDLRELEAAQARVTAQLQAQSGGGGGSGVAGPVRAGSGGLIWPVNGPIVSPFGMRWGRLHAGVDIAAPAGTPVRAAKAGTVVLLGPTAGYGNYICIAHGGGLSTCYAHLSSYATSNGASVSQGQVIGAVGCTGHCFGDHLHFETRVGGAPVNPAGYL